MEKTIFSLCLTCMLSMGAVMAQVANYNVVPLPQTVNLSAKPGFVLNESVSIMYPEGNADMQRNARFLSDYVKEMTQLVLGSQPLPAKAKLAKVGQGNVVLTLDASIQNEEGYTISVTDKNVTISGKTPAGVFLGIQTMRKSLPVLNEKPQAVTLPAVSIADEPR